MEGGGAQDHLLLPYRPHATHLLPPQFVPRLPSLIYFQLEGCWLGGALHLLLWQVNMVKLRHRLCFELGHL